MFCNSAKSFGFGKIARTIDTTRPIFELTSKTKIAKGDLKKFDITNAVEYQINSLSSLENKILEAGENIPEIVNIINEYYGAAILQTANESLSINFDNLHQLVEERTAHFLTKEIRTNPFASYLMLNILRVVNEKLRNLFPFIKFILHRKAIPLSEIVLKMNNQKKFRTCSLNIIQIIIQLVRIQIGYLLVPFQKIVVVVVAIVVQQALHYRAFMNALTLLLVM